MKHHYLLESVPSTQCLSAQSEFPKGLVKVQWLDPTPESDSFLEISVGPETCLMSAPVGTTLQKHCSKGHRARAGDLGLREWRGLGRRAFSALDGAPGHSPKHASQPTC